MTDAALKLNPVSIISRYLEREEFYRKVVFDSEKPSSSNIFSRPFEVTRKITERMECLATLVENRWSELSINQRESLLELIPNLQLNHKEEFKLKITWSARLIAFGFVLKLLLNGQTEDYLELLRRLVKASDRLQYALVNISTAETIISEIQVISKNPFTAEEIAESDEVINKLMIEAQADNRSPSEIWADLDQAWDNLTLDK